jgi:hypothetical protein
MSQKLDKIEQSILDALNDFAKEYWAKNEKGNITEQMFTKLGKLGQSEGYDYIVCSKFGKTLGHETEFL